MGGTGIWAEDLAGATFDTKQDALTWLDSVAGLCRPHQRDELDTVLRAQPAALRASVWQSLTGPSDADMYLHDVLRIHHYLSLHLHEGSREYVALLSLYVGRGDAAERAAMDTILTKAPVLSLVGRCLAGHPLSKQCALLAVMGEPSSGWPSLGDILHATPALEAPIITYFMSLPDDDTFPLWLEIFLSLPPDSYQPWIAQTYLFMEKDCFAVVTELLVGSAQRSALIQRLLGLAPLEFDALARLLVALPVDVASTLVLDVLPIYYSGLASLLLNVSPPLLEQWVLLLARLQSEMAELHSLLLFSSRYADPDAFLTLYFQAPPDIAKQWRATYHALSSEAQTACTDWLLAIPEPPPPPDNAGATQELSPNTVAAKLVALPLPEIATLLELTAAWSDDERLLLAHALVPLHPACVAPFLALMPSCPPATREVLYLVLVDAVADEPRQFLVLLTAIAADQGRNLHQVLQTFAAFDPAHVRSLCRSVWTADVAANLQLVDFLLTPPHDLAPMACLRLLLHLPSLAHGQLLLMCADSARTPLNLIAFTDLLLAVSSMSAATVLAIVQPLDEPAKVNLFNYLHTLNDEEESLLVMELYLHHPLSDVLTFLELTVGMTYSALKELNVFIAHLDLLRQSLLLPLFVDPRRAILSRLVVSCHALDMVTMGDVFASLQPHTWETRSLLIEQVRMLEDASVLSSYLSLHKQAHDPTMLAPLAAYATLASHCGKTVQLMLVKTLVRLQPADQATLLVLYTTTGRPTTATTAQHVRPPAYWLDDLIAHCCRVLLGYSVKIGTEILHTLVLVASEYHKELLELCSELTPDAMFLVHMLRSAGDNVDVLCRLLFCPRLTETHLTTVTVYLQKMLKVLPLHRAIAILHTMPQLSVFLDYFAALPGKMRFLATLAEYAGVAVPLVTFLRILDADDADYVLHTLPTLPAERRHRFEAQLLREPMYVTLVRAERDGPCSPPVLSASEKAIYFGILEGNLCTRDATVPGDGSPVRHPRTMAPMNCKVEPWGPLQVQQHTLAAKPTTVRQLPKRLTALPPTPEVSTPPCATQQKSPPATPPRQKDVEQQQSQDPSDDAEDDVGADMVAPLPHTKSSRPRRRWNPPPPVHLNDDHPHLPPLAVAPRVCTASPTRQQRGLQLALTQLEAPPRRRPTTSPGSPFGAIAKDPTLTTWPPTRIRVARTPEAKRQVFEARIRKAMGTPALSRSTSLPSPLLRPRELQPRSANSFGPPPLRQDAAERMRSTDKHYAWTMAERADDRSTEDRRR
ncbi:hypothetical protein ACHHYP_05911 [Achlya hypogyna]|uniref:Uncharacterized protein n=1 Tax=Achlya hypogyna TaxID=1202772 RepID=A0A1V9YWE8_ACHHY|nr:hypothetical protein ACHHYP_05911 [Achlya hypogyna]